MIKVPYFKLRCVYVNGSAYRRVGIRPRSIYDTLSTHCFLLSRNLEVESSCSSAMPDLPAFYVHTIQVGQGSQIYILTYVTFSCHCIFLCKAQHPSHVYQFLVCILDIYSMCLSRIFYRNGEICNFCCATNKIYINIIIKQSWGRKLRRLLPIAAGVCWVSSICCQPLLCQSKSNDLEGSDSQCKR